jgi:hypothetical protein
MSIGAAVCILWAFQTSFPIFLRLGQQFEGPRKINKFAMKKKPKAK